jgi:hypothetical protein
MRILNRVEQLLERQEYRDSDKKLLLAFWHTQGLELTPQQRDIFMNKCSTAESITRARRALREKHPASEVVEEERYNKFVDYKNNKAVSWL